MQEKLTIVAFLTIIFGGCLLLLITPDRDVSSYERRKLVGVEKLKSDFVDNLDDYMSDQFPFRDGLISLASFVERKILRNASANDVYLEDGYAIEKNYPMDEKSVDNFVKKISYINDNYLKNSRVFYTLLPDKSYFLKEGLRLDFDELVKRVRTLDITYIDGMSQFELEDYYRTDIHIKQPSYLKFVNVLGDAMGFGIVDYERRVSKYDGFYGATYSKVPFVSPDTISYLESEYTNAAVVRHLEYGEKAVYDESAFRGVDAYDVFLSGASSLVEVTNPMLESDRRIVIFRDSFASSLAPLLIPYYKKITLVDLRYISLDNASEYIDFDGADVLFMYSTLIANNSALLKVNTK